MQHGLQQFNKIDRHLAPTGCAVESGLKNFDLLLVAIELKVKGHDSMISSE